MPTQCANIDCANTPIFLIEFSEIGLPRKSTMHLCEACFHQLTDNMGITPITVSSSEPEP